jgi:uncharacterized protein
MKINANQISAEGVSLIEEANPSELDLETEVIKFDGPVKITAGLFKITNTLTVNLGLDGAMQMTCSRCLAEFKVDLKKKLTFVYTVDKKDPVIDLGPQIREEIILDYPMKPLCAKNCKGICPKCGKNFNAGGCSCAIT